MKDTIRSLEKILHGLNDGEIKTGATVYTVNQSGDRLRSTL